MTKPKTLIDDALLQAMLDQSQFAAPQEEEFWYSRGMQKRYVFEIGAKLLVSEEMTPLEAIEMAQEYVDTFYETTMSPQGWKKD
jgi:hypothetical protein